jgi:hypothetical protein
MTPADGILELAYAKFELAVANSLSQGQCLRLWSKFIRERDAHRCVDCHSAAGLSAHHICRKSFLPEAMYQTGNGITLCRACHRDPHKGFNRRPNLDEPMDAEGGEKLDMMERYYAILATDGIERGILNDRFYFLSDNVLAKFKMFQGFDYFTTFPGTRLQQAHSIRASPPQNIMRALITASFLE